MLERELIQSTGFSNVIENGVVTGFQFKLRMPSYRGMAASLIDGVAVHVPDSGVDVAADVPLWTLQGQTRTLAQLQSSDDLRWQLEEAAVVTVPHPGGLTPGVHHLAVELKLRMSYIPIEHQPTTYRVERKVTIVK